jgi:hypothetical protein
VAETEKNRTKAESKYLWRFVTLTFPTLELNVLQSLEFLQEAWAIFRKTELYQRVFYSGGKGVEVTFRELGYHVHIHCLILSPWLEQGTLRKEWTKALKLAAGRKGIKIEFETKHREAIVDVRLARVKNSPDGRKVQVWAPDSSEKQPIDPVREVVKYMTKPSEFLDWPDIELMRLAEIERWPRMFEVLGAVVRKSAVPSARAILDLIGALDASLDNRGLSVPRKANIWKLPRDLPMEEWAWRYDRRVERQTEYRMEWLKYRNWNAVYTLLDGRVFGFGVLD